MSASTPDRPVQGGAPRCAVCGKPQQVTLKPFCSRRCAEIDLGRWLKGGYAIPGRDEDEGDGDAAGARGTGPEREV